MLGIRRISTNRWWHKKKNWILAAIFLFLAFVRITKGSFYKEFYYFISKPFWPGQFQKEVILKSVDQESLIKLNLLKKDNIRLREILFLQKSSNKDNISAAVISRKTGGWWRQIILNKGSKDADIKVGDFVSSSPASSLLPPNIPIGIVQSVDETLQSKKTAKISLLAKPHLIDWVQILKLNI